jgi:hypothetical protein
MKEDIKKFEYQEPYDKEIFSILIRVLKDAGVFKNFSNKMDIIKICYESRMRYSHNESHTRNATYWIQDLHVTDVFFSLLYKGRLLRSVLHDVVKEKNPHEYECTISNFLGDIGLIENTIKSDCDIKKNLLYEFDDTFDFIEKTGYIVSPSLRTFWNKLKSKILCL